jgi:hypothetical protein
MIEKESRQQTYLGTAPKTMRFAFCLLFPITAFFMSLNMGEKEKVKYIETS